MVSAAGTGRKKSFREKFIGDKKFYMMVLGIIIPIMIQNGISNFVNMLDNIMVGQVGTLQMSGVSIANQLFFVFNLSIFGALSGIGLFTAQYAGKKDDDGIRSTVRFKCLIGLVLLVTGSALLLLFGDRLISLYLNDENEPEKIADTLRYGLDYMRIILISLPAFVTVNIYASTLRETGETIVPMKAGIAAVLVNLVFNYFLIFGKFGFPELGVNGAAVATVLSRYVEAAIVVIWTHRHKEKNTWIVGAFRTFRVPIEQARTYTVKGFPLLANELLWSVGQTFMNQSYSLRGLDVVAAQNISGTLTMFLNIIYMTMGSGIGIVVGQLLGAGKMEEAKDTDNKMIAFAIMLSVVSGALLASFSGLFPQIYNTTDSVRAIATGVILINALFVPQQAFMNAAYFTLRSGGKTVITFIFDSVSIWVMGVPIAFCLCRFTSLPILWVLTCVQLSDFVKVIVGYVMLKKNIWIHNIVS